jgi:hypothetical protein
MTREEAIKIFNTVLFFGKCDCQKGEIEECFKIAIKALEQEPFINNPCVSSGGCEHDKQKVLDKLRAEMLEEKECAYADFERYKVEYLGQDWEDVFDSLPHDDFRYGMERAIELIDKYKAESEE